MRSSKITARVGINNETPEAREQGSNSRQRGLEWKKEVRGGRKGGRITQVTCGGGCNERGGGGLVLLLAGGEINFSEN